MRIIASASQLALIYSSYTACACMHHIATVAIYSQLFAHPWTYSECGQHVIATVTKYCSYSSYQLHGQLTITDIDSYKLASWLQLYAATYIAMYSYIAILKNKQLANWLQLWLHNLATQLDSYLILIAIKSSQNARF